MKVRFKKVLVLLLTFALTLSSFSGVIMAADSLGLNQTGSELESVSFAWNEIDGAIRYEYSVDGGSPVGVGLAISATAPGLSEGSSYNVTVTAIGNRDEIVENTVTYVVYRRWVTTGWFSGYYEYYYNNGGKITVPKSKTYKSWGTRYVDIIESTTTTVEYPITSETVSMSTKQLKTIPLYVGTGGVAVINDYGEYGPGSYILRAEEGSSITGNAYSNAGYAVASGASISYTVPASPTAIEVNFSSVGDTHSLPTYEVNGNFSGFHPNGSDIAGHDPRGDVLSATMTATTTSNPYSLGATASVDLVIDVTDGDASTMTLNEVDIYHNLGVTPSKDTHGSVSDGTITKSVTIPSTVAELTDYSQSSNGVYDIYTKGVSFELVDRYNGQAGATQLASASTSIVVQVLLQHSLTWDNATASPDVSGEQDARAGGEVVFTANPATGIEDPATLTWSATGNQGTDNGDGTYTLTGLTADTHVVASYANKKSFSANPSDASMGTVSPTLEYLGVGDSASFTAAVTDSSYYRFVKWTNASGETIGDALVLNVSADEYGDGAVFTAVFEQYAADVSFTTSIYNAVDTATKVTSGELGFVQFSFGGTSFTQNGTEGTRTELAVPYGTVITLEGIPYDSYNYRSVAYKANSANPRTVTITPSKTSVGPHAVFAEKGSYVVTATYNAEHVTFDKEGVLKDDETYTFTATPDSHTVITSASYTLGESAGAMPMSDNGDGIYSVELGNLESDVHFTIVSETTYNVSAVSSNTDYGSVSPASQDYLEGATATVIGTPEPGYTLVSWIIVEDDVTRSMRGVEVLTLEVTGDTSVTANYVNSNDLLPDLYAVRASSNIPAGATFSGTGTGFTDGQAYNVTVSSYDEVNYTFIGFQGVSNGNISGADVDVIALFEVNLIDEDVPEDLPEEPQKPEEETLPEPEPIPEEKPEEKPEEPKEEPVEEPAEEEFLDGDIPEESTPSALPETGGIPLEGMLAFSSTLIGLGCKLRKKKF